MINLPMFITRWQESCYPHISVPFWTNQMQICHLYLHVLFCRSLEFWKCWSSVGRFCQNLTRGIWDTSNDVCRQWTAAQLSLILTLQYYWPLQWSDSPALQWAPVLWPAARKGPQAAAPHLLELSAATSDTLECCNPWNGFPVYQRTKVQKWIY